MKTTTRFQFPKSLGGGDVVMRELTVDEQIDLGNAFEGARTQHEMIKRALLSIDGRPCNADTRDDVWASLSARQRDLVARAYRKIHLCDERDVVDFLASAQTGVES